MRMRKKLNLLNLQAFVAYMYADPEHCLIVAARDYEHARGVAAEFLGYLADAIIVRKTAQRHIRRMETSGVAWQVTTRGHTPPRYDWRRLHAKWGILNERENGVSRLGKKIATGLLKEASVQMATFFGKWKFPIPYYPEHVDKGAK
jgi:hypothetical protein